jgi:lysyl endopeptidase
MTNKRLVKGFSSCVVLLARLFFLGVLVLAPAGSGIAGELSCEEDVACYASPPFTSVVPDIVNVEIPTVGLIIYQPPGGVAPLGLKCTGTLLNDTLNQRKYFLTAWHCLGGGTNTASALAQYVNVYWQWEAAAGCNSHVPPVGIMPQMPVGATYIAGSADTDFLLWELPSYAPASVHAAGWDARPLGTPMYPLPAAPFIGIHQPAADQGAKAISSSSGQPTTTTGSNFWSVSWDIGTAEDGSSGSCLFGLFADPTGTHGRCIGQLKDATPACPMGQQGGGSSTYGKLSDSWVLSAALQTALCPGCGNNQNNAYNNGDPHITTVDGVVHYDFQGAGEYVSLRTASGLEIQTRQAPSPTAPPDADDYDGLATCVSINTAVAARVGYHRVTYEPNFSGVPDSRGVPDPSGFQLRVDGHPTTLGPAGLDLAGGGRIAPIGALGDIEIDFPDHNALQVMLGQFYGKTDLFLHVVRLPVMDVADSAAPAAVSAPSESGLMGAVPKGSWLPALPDGTPLGQMPTDPDHSKELRERYNILYGKFGKAWRVKDKASSLFDYAEEESPETFWNPKWPPEHPPCTIPGTTPPAPASEPVAQEACRQITGKNTHHDCIFDVGVTGNLGFAQTYLAQQQLQLGATKTTVKGDKRVTKYGHSVTFTATVVSAASSSRAITVGSVQFTLDASNAGSPVALDSKGQATWSTSSLQAGEHRVAASYIPSANSAYLASVSPYERHVVLETFDLFMWLALLLLIIVVILIIWWYLRTI